MLIIDVPETELFDEGSMTISKCKPVQLRLEHSLVSLSKWESEWGKSFLSNTAEIREEQLFYIRCMLITKNTSDEIVEILLTNHLKIINDYIARPMTATQFYEYGVGKSRKEIITAELIYYWMIAFNIPFECQKWHLNRLLTLIKVCNIKNSKDKKMDQKSVLAANRSLNERRLAELEAEVNKQ